jgi:hypothetical protein
MTNDNTGAEKPIDPAITVIMRVYAALSASLILGFIPSTIAVVLALILFSCVTPYARHVRKKADPASLTANHMTYIIRTIWIATLLAAVTVTLGTIYVLSAYNPSPLQSCVDNIMSLMQAGKQAGPQMIAPCMDNFMSVNHRIFSLATVISGIPLMIYLAWRLARGISRARDGYRIANLKHWL